MPGHSGIMWFNQGAPNPGVASTSDQRAHATVTCGHCGATASMSVVALVHEAGYPEVRWVRCTNCHRGLVLEGGDQFPGMIPGEDLEGLPADVAEAYREAREAMGVSAFTAGELMCRKILMHVAVDKGAKEGKTFAEYLTYLEDLGYITPPMKPWSDVIRQHGNLATHKIPPADSARGRGTLAFTMQLLRMIYEMDHQVAKFLTPPAPATE